MSPLAWIVSDELLRAVTWTLVHALWQGGLLALGLLLATRVFRPSAPVRYTAGIITLAAMLAAPMLTMTAMWPAMPPAPLVLDTTVAAPEIASMTIAPPSSAPPSAADGHLPSDSGRWWFTLVPLVWSVGVLAFALRLAGGWFVTRRLARTGTQPVDVTLEALARDVAARIGLVRVFRVVESARVASPAMVGWWRPVILLPVATIAGLPAAQLEALIAHELIHVRRRDYVVNLLQTAAETVLFFHPAVWWVSREIRREREHCCDDAVVSVCDRIEYVRALAHLARAGQMRLALGAADGPLLGRVQRLLAAPERSAPGWFPILLVTAIATTAPFGAFPLDAGAAGLAQAPATAAPVPVAPVAAPPPERPVAVPVAPNRSDEVVATPSPAPQAVVAPVALPQSEDVEARVEMLREQMEARQAEYAAIQDARTELEMQREVAKLAAVAVAVEEELQAVVAKAARVDEQVEIGLADAGMRDVVRAQVRDAERRLQSARLELDFATRHGELERSRTVRERELQRLQVEYARAIAARIADAGGPAPAEAAPVFDSRTPIESGDRLVVEIEGGPSFGPPGYPVGDDGTLRLPLIGTFTARGRTIAEVTSNVRAALVRAGLGPEPVVRVHLVRSR